MSAEVERPTFASSGVRFLRFGAERLSDVELLAVALGQRRLQATVALLDRMGGLEGVARAGPRQIAAAGASLPAAVRLCAAWELGRRAQSAALSPRACIATPADVFRSVGPRLITEARELFVALALDCRHRILAERCIAAGALTSVEVRPRDAFRPLLLENAAAVIFVHNHPSGDPTPSDEDRRLSRQLVEAGRLLGIRVLDHIVVAQRGYASALHGGPVCSVLACSEK